MNEQNQYTIWESEDLSRTYLEGVRGAIPLASEQIDVLLRTIRAAGIEVNSFLDLGCGNGILGGAIAREYPDAKGCFLDLSETMLNAARSQVGEGNHTSFILQDFGLPDWTNAVKKEAPFDVIVSGFSIHHQRDRRKQEIYAEIYNLLQPGGLFLNLEHIASRSPWGEQAFNELFVDRLYAFHRDRGSDKSREEIGREYYSRDDKSANILAPVEEQCNWLREIGFIDVDCFMKIFEIALFGGMRSQISS
ncbi:MAG: class I SAM-dependent methyltransferase [Cyanobacteriota bacterium]|nr:class I SAM-dependent methyltransferase [Cyanobacteriota bacterium]